MASKKRPTKPSSPVIEAVKGTNWKTTLAGILLITNTAASVMVTGPENVQDWNPVITSVIASIGLIVAKDNSKTK